MEVTVLSDRLLDANRQHWGEFAALIAGASATTAVVAIGALVAGDQSSSVKVALAVLIGASTVGTVVSYYGILNGTLLTVAPLGPIQIISSLLVSGAQIGSILLVASVAAGHRRNYPSVTSSVVVLRYYFLLQALLAASAALANEFSSRDRAAWSTIIVTRLQVTAPTVRRFNEAQRAEVKNATRGAVAAVAILIALLIRPWVWLCVVGGLVQAGAMAHQIAKQRYSSRQLWSDQLGSD
jgi:hypothetical protein